VIDLTRTRAQLLKEIEAPSSAGLPWEVTEPDAEAELTDAAIASAAQREKTDEDGCRFCSARDVQTAALVERLGQLHRSITVYRAVVIALSIAVIALVTIVLRPIG